MMMRMMMIMRNVILKRVEMMKMNQSTRGRISLRRSKERKRELIKRYKMKQGSIISSKSKLRMTMKHYMVRKKAVKKIVRKLIREGGILAQAGVARKLSVITGSAVTSMQIMMKKAMKQKGAKENYIQY